MMSLLYLMSLPYFLSVFGFRAIAKYLSPRTLLDRVSHRFRVHGQQFDCRRLHRTKLVGRNILLGVLGKAVEKDRPVLGSIADDCPISSAAALSGPSHTLLDEVASKVSISQAALCAIYGLAQSTIPNVLLAREPRELLCLEDPPGRQLPNI
jgi:hypothetical protein